MLYPNDSSCPRQLTQVIDRGGGAKPCEPCGALSRLGLGDGFSQNWAGLGTAPERMDTIFGVGVYVYCFNDQGDYLGYHVDFTADETLEAGEQTVFVVDVPKSSCPNYAIEAYDI